ncbi:hypothetical protein LJB86_04100 [Deltaproteobacteria bacterium OttesenSCG-928-M10]|nr:hypothetical protein [Deltaproteobacteria bacterium OttesenSCG-928-M10]
MSEQKLGKILKDMYDSGDKGAHIILFGIKYADVIVTEKLNIKKIVMHAGLPESYPTEISKGVRLAKYVSVKAK